MTTTRAFRPSDFVVWSFTDLGASLRKMGTATRLVDTEDDRNTTGRFTARYRWTLDGEFPDPTSPHWTLWTQGASVGGRRYRECLTLEEAQRIALAWLDRRFRAVDAKTGEAVR